MTWIVLLILVVQVYKGWTMAVPGNGGLEASLTSINVEASIQFRYARTIVEAVMTNPDHSMARKGIFEAIIPEQAFIRNFSITDLSGEHVARVMEAETADRLYQVKVNQGATAGLVSKEWSKSNLFRVNTNIAPGDTVLFRLTYDELLERQLGQYAYMLALKPQESLEKYSITVNIDESLPLLSLRAPIISGQNSVNSVEEDNTRVVIQRDIGGDPSRANVKLSSDGKTDEKSVEFLLRYDVDRKDVHNEVQVIDGYFVHYFTPAKLPTLPKHAIFVLDISGSMRGDKIEQLKDAMFTILDEMTENDLFSIVTFSSRVSIWKTFPLSATKSNVKLGIDFVYNLQPFGQTNINDALLKGIALAKTHKDILPNDVRSIVVFLTDGLPNTGTTDKDSIRANVGLSNTMEIPIYGIAFGKDADFTLLKEIAQDTSSLAKYVYEGSDAALQLENFFALISSKLLEEIDIKYLGEAVNQSSISKSSTKSLFKGGEVVITGELNNLGPEYKVIQVQITGKGASGAITEDLTFCIPPRENQHQPPPASCHVPHVQEKSQAQNFLKELFSFLHIKQLLKGNEVERRKALEISLENNFVTDVTSLVVATPSQDSIVPLLRIRPIDKSIRDSSVQIPLSGSNFSPSGPAGPPGNYRQTPLLLMKDQVRGPSLKFKYKYNYDGWHSSTNGRYASTSLTPLPNYHYTTSTSTAPIPADLCSGSLTLFSGTYHRGNSTQLTDNETSLDLGDIGVSAVVEGSCCWLLFDQEEFSGQKVRLVPGKQYSGVSSLGNLRRNVKSAQRFDC